MQKKISLDYNSSLSIVSACYNEEREIEKTVISWINYLKKKFKKFEIVITDDGSTDNTVTILNKLKKKNKEIKVYKFKKNLGASIAFNNSIKKSKNNYILVNDSDNQFPINNFINLWKEIKYNKHDVIIGSRNRLKELTFLSIGSYISGKIMNIIYRSNIKDFNCALKLAKSKVLKKINLEAVGLNYSIEMTAKLIETNSRLTSVNVFHNKNKKKKKIKIIIKDSIDRILFMIYLIFRVLLIKLNILKI